MNIRKIIIVGLILFSFACAGYAQDTGIPDPARSSEVDLPIADDGEVAPVQEDASLNVFNTWDFVRMILILAAVVGVIYLIYFILKKTSAPKFSENQIISVLASTPVANNRSVHLLEVGTRMFLVGVSDSAINLISEIDDKESVDEVHLRVSAEGPRSRANFSEVFSGMFSGSGREKAAVPANPFGFMKQQRDRLKEM